MSQNRDIAVTKPQVRRLCAARNRHYSTVSKAPTQWLLARPRGWLEQIRWGVLDLSGPYRAAFDAAA